MDPAALHPDVLSACPNIRHLRVKAEAQAVPLVMQALDGQMVRCHGGGGRGRTGLSCACMSCFSTVLAAM